MAFYNSIKFPEEISYGSESSLRFETEVFIGDGGYENRNAVWDAPLYAYNVAYGVKTLDELYDVMAIFLICKGRLHTFRYRDPLDYTSLEPSDELARDMPVPLLTDQVLGTGDGAETDFQLVKRYVAGGITKLRNITAPEAATVLVGVDGVLVDSADYTLNSSTGVITFDTAPALGEVVTAGFEFDVKVRFDVDELPVVLEKYGMGAVNSIRLVEVRE